MSGQNNAINAPLPLSFAQGGTGAALTASNGGIFYSGSTTGAILSGTPTQNQILLSGASTTPAWSTATYPATTTLNSLLYSSAANVIGSLTATAFGTLVTGTAGIPSIQALTAGQILIGTTSAAPTAATLTAGAGISITSVSGSITIASTEASANWIVQASSVALANNTSYIANSASLVTFTLPTVCAVGTEFAIAGLGTGGWKIAQNAVPSQFINFGNVTTTAGVTGFLSSSNQSDVVFLVCTVANTQFSVLGSVGNLNWN